MADPGSHSNAREMRLREVLDLFVRRRASGEDLPDAALIAAHPELMPELAERLRALALVQQALAAAPPDPAGVTRDSTAMPGETVPSPSAFDAVELTGAPHRDLPHGDSIPGYEILREIHRGGQGVVYQALHKSTKRRVAIKVMKEGPFAGAADKARFEREVQILGQLQHPNIVGVHDSGSAGGNDYFVMDYVPGLPLDVHMAGAGEPAKRSGGPGAPARTPGLSVASTLDLFAKICEAVNAAHLRGVIHRDLKPGNIRVDPAGEPHILDFGLAKVSAFGAGGEAGAPVMTMTGQFIGSLPWASPEQAEGQPSKIDVRTDVYSLGVILYQMLTGRFPYEVVGNMRDVLDRILRAEPARPSTVRRQIDDEVETIVLKCLAKERERRYQTAGELARDIRHYLAGEPIEAKRDSALYVLRKTLRRYRGLATAASLVVAALLLGLITTVWQARRANERAFAARKAEVAAQAAESEQRRLAELEAAARKEAERKTAEAERVGYSANILAADLSIRAHEFPEARRLLSACPNPLRGWEWSWLYSRCDASVALLPESRGCREVAVTRDGRQIYASSSSGVIHRWDAGTYAPLPLVGQATAAPARRAVAGVDGARLVLASGPPANDPAGQAVVSLIATDSGQVLTTLDVQSAYFGSCAFSDDGTRMMIVGRDGVSIFDAGTGAAVARLEHEPGWAGWPHAIGPDGARVAEVVRDAHAVCIWQVGADEAFAFKAEDAAPQALAFGPGAARLAVAYDDGAVTVYDLSDSDKTTFDVAELRLSLPMRLYGVPDGRVVVRLAAPTKRALRRVAFSPDGQQLAAGSALGVVYVWDISTGRLQLALAGHDGPVSGVTFLPDGKLIVSCAEDGVRVWRSNSDARPSKLLCADRMSALGTVSFDPIGERIVASDQLQASTWDSATGDPVGKLFSVAARSVHPLSSSFFVKRSPQSRILASSADGSRLILSDQQTDVAEARARRLVGSETISIVDPASDSTTVVLFEGDLLGARDACFSADGRRVALRTQAAPQDAVPPRGRSLGVYQADSGRLIWSCDVSSRGPNEGLALSCDGARIAVAPGPVDSSASDRAADVLFSVLEVDSGATVCRAKSAGVGGCRTLVFSPDGERIASIAWNVGLGIWDGSTGEFLGALRGHSGNITAVAFSPDRSRIISAGEDGTLRIWEADTFELLLTIREHTASVHSVAFSPDGSRVVSGGEDGIRLFDARSPRVARTDAPAP